LAVCDSGACSNYAASFAPQQAGRNLTIGWGDKPSSHSINVWAWSIKHREPVVVAGNRLAINDARAGAQVSQRFNNQGKTLCEIITRTAVEPHLRAILTGDDAEAVMFDFVQPQPARRQRIGRCGKARLDKAGR
jgi:hypothetical protein